MSCTDQDIGKLIGSYELGLLSEEENRRFENHLLDCEYCFQSLYRTAPLAILMREGRLAPASDIELTDEEEGKAVISEPPSGSGLIRIFGKKWAYAAAGAAAVMVIALIVLWLQGPWRKTERLRGHDEVSILVLSPVGEVTALSELRWKAVVGVDSYEVRIYTAAGDLVWEESVRGFSAVLPGSIREILIPGQTYVWQVEALTAGGDRLKSQMIQFRIRK